MLQRFMDDMRSSYGDLSNAALIAEVQRLANHERDATAQLVATLAVFDERKLYLAEGCASLYVYCTRVLRLSEHAAYSRIQAARTANRYPVIFDMLFNGETTVTNVELLAPILTEENHRELLDEARNCTKRDVQLMVARVDPRPDVPCIITPLGPDRFSLQITIGTQTYAKLKKAQDLLRHVTPLGDLDLVIGRALDLLLPSLERARYGKTDRPRQGRGRRRSRTRYVPRAVQRAVWARDGGRCAFVGPQGRCTETAMLEFHHVDPYAAGGPASVSNIELRCRAHNQYESDVAFGGAMVTRERPPMYGPDSDGEHYSCRSGQPAASSNTSSWPCWSCNRTSRPRASTTDAPSAGSSLSNHSRLDNSSSGLSKVQALPSR